MKELLLIMKVIKINKIKKYFNQFQKMNSTKF